jgi:hypothetical protein
MHREKTVARIVLVLSIVHGALAAPAVVRQRHLDVAEDVTATPEKRNLDDESWGTLQMRDNLPGTSGNPQSPKDSTTSTLETPQVHDDLSSASGVSDEPPHRLLSNLHWTPSQSSHSDAEVPPGESHSALEVAAPGRSPGAQRATNSLAGKFFTDAVKQKLKFWGAIGATLGVSGSILYGIHKLNEPNTGSSGSYVSFLLTPSPADI